MGPLLPHLLLYTCKLAIGDKTTVSDAQAKSCKDDVLLLAVNHPRTACLQNYYPQPPREHYPLPTGSLLSPAALVFSHGIIGFSPKRNTLLNYGGGVESSLRDTALLIS